MAQGESTRPKGQKHKKLMLVRYGRMRLLGWFEHNETTIPPTKSRVVVKTRRGLELGEIVGEFNYRGGQFRGSVEQVRMYYGDTGREQPVSEGGAFIRFATDEDLNEQKHLEAAAREEAQTCRRFIQEMGLPMKVVDAEHLFGGERVIIYFTSNGRVDFRELVRRLAREYQTRIELRQIGSRDEARLISDYESCGQECCCRRFLKVLQPVNMRMAKLQKATLDPSKISGHCGRLKCCLRYEDQTYRELREQLPRKNTPVRTPSGTGRVVDTQILTQLVVVLGQDGKREAWPLEEIEILDGTKPSRSGGRRSKDKGGTSEAVEGKGGKGGRDRPKGRGRGRRRDGGQSGDTEGEPAAEASQAAGTEGQGAEAEAEEAVVDWLQDVMDVETAEGEEGPPEEGIETERPGVEASEPVPSGTGPEADSSEGTTSRGQRDSKRRSSSGSKRRGRRRGRRRGPRRDGAQRNGRRNGGGGQNGGGSKNGGGSGSSSSKTSE